MVPIAPGITATPDRRYARGVPTGAVAELFGLGPDGIRWRQVITLGLGLTISDNIWFFMYGEPYTLLDTRFLIPALLVTAFFLFGATTAIRSFQNALAVALLTGVVYAALATALLLVRIRIGWMAPLDELQQSLPRRILLSFLWPFLTLLAIQYAVVGDRRWVRLATGLVAAALLYQWIASAYNRGLFDALGWLLDRDFLLAVIVGSLTATGSYWLALTLFGRRQRG